MLITIICLPVYQNICLLICLPSLFLSPSVPSPNPIRSDPMEFCFSSFLPPFYFYETSCTHLQTFFSSPLICIRLVLSLSLSLSSMCPLSHCVPVVAIVAPSLLPLPVFNLLNLFVCLSFRSLLSVHIVLKRERERERERERLLSVHCLNPR